SLAAPRGNACQLAPTLLATSRLYDQFFGFYLRRAVGAWELGVCPLVRIGPRPTLRIALGAKRQNFERDHCRRASQRGAIVCSWITGRERVDRVMERLGAVDDNK